MLPGDSNANSKAIICKPKLMSKDWMFVQSISWKKDKKYSPRLVQHDHKLLWTFLSDVRGSIYSTTELEDYNYRLPFWLGRFLTNASLETRLCIYFGPTYVVQIQVPIFIHFCFILQKTLEHFHVICTFVFLMKIIILHTCTRQRFGIDDWINDGCKKIKIGCLKMFFIDW